MSRNVCAHLPTLPCVWLIGPYRHTVQGHTLMGHYERGAVT